MSPILRFIKLPSLLAIAVLCLLFPLSVHATNYYISATGPTGDGSGSSADNAADASTAAKLWAINEAQHSPGTVIMYGPGTFLVTPSLSMFDGVTHQGAGIDSTIIKIADGAAPGWSPMWLAKKGTISNFKFTDATIDFNATKTGWWAKGSGQSMAFAFSTADHCIIQRVKFINIGAKKNEAFPIFFIHSNSAPGNLHDNLVDSCIFTQPVPKGNNDGGLSCIMMADAEPKITVDDTNVVSNNQFINLKGPEYSDLPYTQCCTCPVTINNKATGVDALWFLEPGTQNLGNNVYYSGQTLHVSGNTLIDSGELALVLMHPNGHLAGDLVVENNTVGMTEHPYLKEGPRGPTGVSIETYWKGDSSLANILVQNNTFTAPLPMKTPPIVLQANPKAGSGNYFHMASLSFLNNTMVNFPHDGKEYNVTTDPQYNPKYTNSGCTFTAGN